MANTHFFTSQFFSGEFFFGGAVVAAPDTHDGARKRKQWRSQIEAKERLHEQIRIAIEGPDAEIIEKALEPYAAPQLADAVFVPLLERIDWNALTGAIADIEHELRAAMQRAEDDDDEDFMLLL